MKRIQQALQPFYVAYVKDVHNDIWSLAISPLPCEANKVSVDLHHIDDANVYRFSRSEIRKVLAAIKKDPEFWRKLEYKNKVTLKWGTTFTVKAVNFTLMDAQL